MSVIDKVRSKQAEPAAPKREEPAPAAPVKGAALNWAFSRVHVYSKPWYVSGGVAAAGLMLNEVPTVAVGGLSAVVAVGLWKWAGKRLSDADAAVWGRRRRLAGWAAGAGAVWTTAASAVDWSAGGARAWMLLALAALSAPAAAAHARRVDQLALPAPVAAPAIEAPATLDQWTDMVERIVGNWNTRVANKGRLAGTRLHRIHPVPGGWGATIVTDWDAFDDKTIEAVSDRWEQGVTKVAMVYGVGLMNVTITLDNHDASRARIMVQSQNPLWDAKLWDGSGWNEDGTAVIGIYAGGKPMVYRFYDDGGCWHDLISGATGGGKSELVNVLLCYEIKSGMTASYLIDPQCGQSYGEITDCLAGFAGNIDEARVLLARIEAEMYRRNEAYASMTWTQTLANGRTRQRRGIKTWRPTRELPMLSVTIDEAHTILKDKVCKEIVARLVAMGRKCGIRVRLVTQVPLLTSLGGKMEIRDAVAAGNVIVFRTGNRLSGEVAANGTLPGKPHKLPRRWPNGTTAAGVCYSVGEGSRPEMARTVYIGDDFYDLLFAEDGAPRWEKIAPDLPAPVALPKLTGNAAADAADEEDPNGGGSARDKVLAYFLTRPGELVERADILAEVDVSPRSVGYALSKLTEGDVCPVESVGWGKYMLREEMMAH